MIYLASPYSHPDPDVRAWRFRVAAFEASVLMNGGFHVFSPICHSHPIAVAGGLPTDWAFWEPYDRKILAICSCFTVLRMPGWDQSIGVAAENKIAKEFSLHMNHIERDVWKDSA